MKTGKRKYAGILAWLLGFTLILTMFNIPAMQVKAETTAIDLQLKTGIPTAADSGNKVEIQFSPAAGYSTLKALADAGYSTFQVELNITSYNSVNDGTSYPGIMPFIVYGETWTNNNVWVNLEKTGTVTVTLDLSSISTSDTQNIAHFGVQIANITGSFACQVTSAKLLGGSGSSGGIGDNTQDVNTDVDYNFAKLLQESLYLYDANMCGTDVDENSAFTWRSDCHTDDQYVVYNNTTVDVSGGYHDAGDHVKFGLPQAYAASVLGLSYYQFQEAYQETGAEGHYIRIMDRFVEYFEKCTILDSNGDVEAFCYQVGSGNTDHAYWGAPEAQAQRTTQGYFTNANTPATDIVSETAAALAIYYCNFKDTKPEDATVALEYAEKLFTYANSFSNKAVVKIEGDNSNGGTPFYDSTSWEDDYALAAAWLYRATGNESYKTCYNNVFGSRNYLGWVLSWDDVSAAALLYGPDTSKTGYVSSYITSNYNNVKDNNYCFITNWGSARYNAALQFMGLAYDDIMSTNSFGAWAEGQMKYLLGNNEGKHCFVVGYNSYSVKYPHHRAASGYNDVTSNSQTTLQHLLVGALVGGPDSESTSYVDSATNYATNEVALDYNAGLVAAAAGLYMYVKNYGSDEEKAAQVKVEDESALTSEMRTSVVKSNSDFSFGETTEESSTEEPSTEKPSTEEPSTEKPSTEEPSTEEPSTEESSVHIHSWKQITVKAPTCTEEGYTLYQCESCKETKKENIIPATGHTASAWIIDTAATVSAPGSRHQECSVCHAALQTEILLYTPTVATPVNTAEGVNVSWNKIGGAAGYLVYRKTSGSSWTRIATITSGSTTSYVDTTGVSGTTYYYTVRANTGSVLSGYDSTGKSIKYLSQPTINVANSSTGITVSWNKIGGAAGYLVYRKTSGSSWARIATITSGSTTSYIDTTAASGTTYYYTVRANSGSVLSSYHTTGKGIKYLSQPSLGTPANVSTGVQISWSKSTGASGYFVYRKTNGGSWSRIATITNVNTLSYIDTTAASGTSYFYTVRSYSGSTLSSYLTAGKAIRYLSQPSVKATAATGRITVSWSKVTGASGYFIYRKTSGNSWVKIATVTNVNTISYADTTTKAGTKYIYTVRAYAGTYISSYATAGASATAK